MRIALAKYEALGNDFLVLVDPDRCLELDSAAVRALCDRRLGVGADGLLRLTPGSPSGEDRTVDLVMELTNADGSPAETSGNGIRCAVLAALDSGLVPPHEAGQRLLVATGAGAVEVELLSLRADRSAEMAADMGTVSVVEEPESPLEGWRAFAVDVGNPHLVLLGGPAAAGTDLSSLGPRLERSRPRGVNVELVTPLGDRTSCRLEVWERGAGLTLACGSGSCAAAAAVRAVGLAGDEVEVANPGGVLRVSLAGPPLSPRARLAGPASRVASVEVELSRLVRRLSPVTAEVGA